MDKATREALEAKTSKEGTDRFIGAHREFILSCVSRVTRRHTDISDETYAIGMEAFSEALDSFDETKGEFLPFASIVIRRRLYDEARRMKPEFAVSPMDFEGKSDFEANSTGQEAYGKMVSLADEAHQRADTAQSVRNEIAEAQELLQVYGFSFFDLIDCSPKSKRTKAVCREAVICLLRPGELYEKMVRTRHMPIGEIVELTGLPRKKLERHRKYIMAVAELLHGDFPHLVEYLSDIRKELSL
ncbi:MAG: RNA polymerase subunit sigma [Lachnospiraceae bacterium]|nr:RNA polymerase subunit sigma [Lachnospiraceae bacterium]